MARVTVRIDRAAVNYMAGWNGDIGRSIDKLSRLMAGAQRVAAPKKSGKLIGRIRHGPHGRGAVGIETWVGANPSTRGNGAIGYAVWTDQGTRPHKIKPRDSRKWLVFYWAKVGHRVAFKSVNHPGIRHPSHWAERGAEAGMIAWHIS
jgi:hypothetical protein